MSLANDVSRCRGYPPDVQQISGAALCIDCQRRTQIAIDTETAGPDAFFWSMGPAINNGRCVYYIVPKD